MKATFIWVKDIRSYPVYYVQMFGTRQITNALGVANHCTDCDEWLIVVQDDTVLAFSGYEISNKVMALKRAFVYPEYRGFGIYKTMIDMRINRGLAINVNIIQCTATRMSMKEFEKRGFKAVKNYKKYVTYRMTI